MKTVSLTAQELVERVAESPESSFYRDRWNVARRFSELPTTSRYDFIATSFAGRRYKRTPGIAKLVHAAQGSFFSQWDKDDIRHERYGQISSRPFVYFADSCEAVEKAMWCYLNGSVPLIGERNEEVSLYMARAYHINQLVADEASIRMLLPHLAHLPEKLESILVFGDTFDTHALLALEQYSRTVHLVLSLPETGSFAEAQLSKSPIFRAYPDCTVENDGALVLTKLRFLTTPIIRYKTDIRIADVLGVYGTFRLEQRG